MFHRMPFVLLAIILFVLTFGHWIPPYYQSLIYGLSLSIKSAIIFVLPFVVFSLLFKTTLSFANSASKVILLILAAICCSNFISTMLSYSVGSVVYQFDLSIQIPHEKEALGQIGAFEFPKWIGNDQALFAGLISGLILNRFRPLFAKSLSLKLEAITKIILRGILMIIPVFIAGFIIKMHHDEVMTYIVHHYALIFTLTASAVFFYIVLLYFIANAFHWRASINALKNIFPAAIAGFGSMSSAAAMPLTIIGAEKNSNRPNFADTMIPTTVNIHLIGDCFAIPIFAFAVLKGFGILEPSFLNYVIFAGYFVFAKFSVAAVPGGGILVMLPILEKYLGFNAEMLSLITALYILFDPVITSANVLGNGGFALIMERMISFKKETSR